MKNRFLFLCAVPILLFCLCACKKTENTQISSKVYAPEKISFTAGSACTEGGCVMDDYIYLLGTDDTANAAYGSFHQYSISRLPLNGGAAEKIMSYQPSDSTENAENSENAELIAASLHGDTDGTICVCEQIYISGLGRVSVLRQLDTDGIELFRFEVAENRLNLGSVYDLRRDTDGCIFALCENGVCVLDGSGTALFALKIQDGSGNKLITLGDGRTGVRTVRQNPSGEVFSYLQTIDKDAKDWGELFQLPANCVIFSGKNQDLFYFSEGDNLYARRVGSDENELLLRWTDSGLDAGMLAFFSFLNDGKIAAVTFGEGRRAAGTEICLLTAADASALPPKITLTYGTMVLSPTERKTIVDFNKASDTYFISVKEYAGGTTYQNGLLRLSADIAVGNMPDLLHTGDLLPVRQYGAKGLLEDLRPYIDRDNEISRENLMERVLAALEQNGKLYQISNSFSIVTLVGAKEIVGDRMSWTSGDLWAALEKMPENCGVLEGGSKELVLQKMMSLYADQFVDWENGSCCFDGEAFQALLEFCNQFPDKNNENTPFLDELGVGVYLGKQMLLPVSLGSFDAIQELQTLFGGDIAYVGYPNDSGRTGSSFSVFNGLAMASSCDNKDGAWEFMRRLLLPRPVENADDIATNFPINKDDFALSVEKAMTPVMQTGRDGVAVETPRWSASLDCGDFMIDFEYFAAKQEDYEQFMELYEATENLYETDDNLINIVLESAGAYFAGDKSLEETVGIVQGKVTLYMNEQK